MVAHFVQNCDPTCQRCEFGNLRPAPRETISHIFWDCPKISEILLDLNIKKKSIVFTLIFIWSSSPEDDSNEPCNLKLNNSPCFETKAINLNTIHFNITFYIKFGLFLYLDNLEQSMASYRGGTKVKTSIDTLIGNLRSMLNTQEIHDANHCKWFANVSYKVNGANAHIKIVKCI